MVTQGGMESIVKINNNNINPSGWEDKLGDFGLPFCFCYKRISPKMINNI